MIGKLINKFLMLVDKLLQHKNSLKFQAIMSLALRMSIPIIAFVITWWLATILGPEELGVYTYAFSIITLLSVFAQFGLPNLTLREVSQGNALSEWSRVKGIVFWALGLSIGLALLLIVMSVLATLWQPFNIENLDIPTLYWGLVMLPFLAINPILGGVLRAMGRMVEGLLMNDALKGAIFLASLLIMSVFDSSRALLVNNGASAAMATQMVAVIVTCVIGFLFLQKNWPKDAKEATPEYFSYTWRKQLLPFAALGGMAVLNRNIDILMLGVLSTPSDVGYYKIAMQLSSLVSFGLAAIILVIAPRFSDYYARQDFAGLKRSAQMSTRAAIIFALPTSVIIIGGGQFIISTFFGEIYLAAYLPLVFLTIGDLANASVGPASALLSMTGYERDAANFIFFL